MSFNFKSLIQDSLINNKRILWENLSERYYPDEFKNVFPDKEAAYDKINRQVSQRAFIPFVLKNSDDYDVDELVKLVNYYYMLIRSGVIDKFIRQTKTRLDVKDINSWKNVESLKSFLKSVAGFAQETENKTKVIGGTNIYEDKSSVVIFMHTSNLFLEEEDISMKESLFSRYLKLGKMVYVIADRLQEGFKKTFVVVNIDGSREDSLLESIAVEWKDKKIMNAIDTHHKQGLKNWIKQHEEVINWKGVSYSEILPEEFIDVFQDKVDWTYVSQKQKLSESFIEKHEHLVNWKEIAKHQTLSAEFIYKYQKQLPWSLLSLNPNIPDSVKEKYRKSTAAGKPLHNSVMQSRGPGNQFIKREEAD